ncbi:MAG: 50S ribosomal protein L25 [bacterium]|nr:50S ribosomal protein L25 [bacterium]
MKRPQLKVEKRELLGKKIKKLRKEGILPGNVYGKDVKSTAVQVPLAEFQKTYKEVGETGLLDLLLDSQTRPVLIHNLQVDSLTKLPLHADFFQVNLKEKVKTMVHIEIVGEAKAVSDKIGLVLQPLSEIEVEALPEALPEKIEVNIEPLAAIDQQITVGDLKLPQGVEVLTDPTQVVVKIAELVSKEAEEQAAEEAAAKEAAKAEGETPAEGAEGAEPSSPEAAKAEGEVKPETPKQEEKK